MKPQLNKGKKITNTQRLNVVRFLLESDYDEEANTDEARILNGIYRTVHPSGRCQHRNWDIKTQEILDYLNRKK